MNFSCGESCIEYANGYRSVTPFSYVDNGKINYDNEGQRYYNATNQQIEWAQFRNEVTEYSTRCGF